MVRFVHISDAHLGYHQYGKIERFRDFGRIFKKAIEFAVNNSVDFIIIGGDLFEQRKINAATLLQTDKCLSMAKENEIPVIVCEGNHDSTSYRETWSWLGYLSEKDHIILLGSGISPDTQTDGRQLVPWDPVKRVGSFYEREFNGAKVRFYGFGYLGAATKIKLKEYSKEIIRDDAVNIGLLHAGIEGVITNMHGTIPENHLKVLRDKLDYLALGHIHKKFEVENWAFNPGSLENRSLDEGNFEHGFYLVELKSGTHGNPEPEAEFIDTKHWRRPSFNWRINLAGVDSKDRVMAKVKRKLSTKGFRTASSSKQDNKHDGMETPVESQRKNEISMNENENKQNTDVKNNIELQQENSGPKNNRIIEMTKFTQGKAVTLDAYIRSEENDEENVSRKENNECLNDEENVSRKVNNECLNEENVSRKVNNECLNEENVSRKVYEDETETNNGPNSVQMSRAKSYDTLQVKEQEDFTANQRSENQDDRNPIVVLKLEGIINLKEPIDVEPIKHLLRESIEPEPLYLDVRDGTQLEGAKVDDMKKADKKELENQVLRDLLSQGEYSSKKTEIITIMKDIKKAIAMKKGLGGFPKEIRKIAEDITTRNR